MYFYLAILSGIFFVLSALYSRHALKGGRVHHLTFSFHFSILAAIVSAPFAFYNAVFTLDIVPWLVLLLVSALVVASNYFYFKAIKYIEASFLSALSKLRLLWVLILAVVFLGETLTIYKSAGTFLIILSGVFLFVISKKQTLSFNRGLFYGFIATFAYAVGTIFYKYLLESFSPEMLTFLIFLIPAGLNFVLLKDKKQANLFKFKEWKSILLSAVFGAFANLAIIYAINIGEVSRVVVITESMMVLIIVGEYFFLRERKSLLAKIFVTVLVMVGAALMKI